MASVHGVKRLMQQEQPAADFQRRKVCAEQDDAVAACARLNEVFQTFYLCEAGQPPVRRPPGESRLKDPLTEGFEVQPEALLALVLRQRREAQRQIDERDLAPAYENLAGEPAQQASQSELHAQRQQHQQPHHAESDPGEPIARAQEIQEGCFVIGQVEFPVACADSNHRAAWGTGIQLRSLV